MADKKAKNSRKGKPARVTPKQKTKPNGKPAKQNKNKTAQVKAENQNTSAVTAPVRSTSVPIVPQQILVEGDRVEPANVHIPVKDAMYPSEIPGNSRFVFGKDAKTQQTAMIIDRIANGKIAEFPILPNTDKRFKKQVKITSMLVQELEELFADREFPTAGKEHVRALFGAAIAAVGQALAAYN